MIIKSLELENIRSYKHATIELPLGVTLFEGDIGSGKSTLLMAIEFALFGTGTQPGGSLLKYNESTGGVTLVFDVDGNEYRIKRTLSRKDDRVLQGQGYFKGPDGRVLLSASELKERVLDILNFNEPPNARAQNVIYRYAVFTPQEEMKTIISLNPDERLQTLRRALRIEEYKLARDNANVLTSSCDKRASNLSAAAEDLEKKKHDRKDIDTQITECETTLVDQRAKQEELDSELAILAHRYDSLLQEKEELKKAEGKHPQLQKQKDDKQREVVRTEDAIKNAGKQLGGVKKQIEEQSRFTKPTDQEEDAINADIEAVTRERESLQKQIHRIEFKMGNYKDIITKGVCPTCDRVADPAEFNEKIAEEERARTTLAALADREEAKGQGAKNLLMKLQTYNHAQEKVLLLQKQLDAYQETQTTNTKKIEQLTQEINDIERELEKTSDQIEALREVSRQVEELRGRKSSAEDNVAQTRGKIVGLEATIAQLERSKETLDAEITQKEAKLEKADVLSQYKTWLNEFYIPTLGSIERHVMISFQQEFNQFFQKWFGMLVDDPTKDARIDESFRPIVEQDGFEQSLDYLSGGEKTSVALAYRLALNMIVRKAATSMKSNLLILDEPTDGFSKEQLLKMQDIFAQLECPQMIIVSHERELESFADRVFWVSKSSGVSTIEAT